MERYSLSGIQSFSLPRLQGVGAVVAALAVAMICLTVSLSKGAPASDGGKELFEKRCGGCHAMDRNKEGPRLGGVYGRAAGSVESFEYSAALKRSGITWTEETLDQWLTDTDKVVPENDMAFRVSKPDERLEIISWLKRNSGK
jgi:cytochrome c